MARLGERRIRGVDSAGLVFQRDDIISVKKREFGSEQLIKITPEFAESPFIAGHSRLITNDVESNQPVVRDNFIVLHNGIITNHAEIWPQLDLEPATSLDSELIPALFGEYSSAGFTASEAVKKNFRALRGCYIGNTDFAKNKQGVLFSNNRKLVLWI